MPMIPDLTLSLLLIFSPALAGVLVIFVPGTGAIAHWLGAAASAVSVFCAIQLGLVGGSETVLAAQWVKALEIDISFRINPLTLSLAGMVAGIGAIILHYCGHYFAPGQKRDRVIATLSLFESAMLGVVLSDNLYLIFIFWELTGLCSFFLIATDSDKDPDAPLAAKQALLVTVGGGLPMLIGFIYLASMTGTASLAQLAANPPPPDIALVALAFILPGVLTKSAQFPFHFWLPGAMAAPTPISAYLHSATMVKAGVILLLFLYPVLGESWLWHTALIPLGAVTMLWGSFQALRQDDIKILMAWSTVAQLGLLVTAIGIGSPLSIRGAVMHLFAHAFFKAALFLVVGIVYHETHTRLLSKLGGMRTVMPLLAVACAACAASMAGAPPFAGFLSKEIILEAGFGSWGWARIVSLAAITLGSIGTVWYSARFYIGIFEGEQRSDDARHAHKPAVSFESGTVFLALLTVGIGFAAGWFGDTILNPAVTTLSRAEAAAGHLALWHGVNVPLITSITILSAGFLLHRRAGLKPLAGSGFGTDASVLFEQFQDGCKSVGSWLNRYLSAANPSWYFAAAIIAGFAGAIVGIPSYPYEFSMGELPIAAWMVIAVQALSIAGIFSVRSRLARALLLSAVGFSTAVLYRIFRAPDLVLTQVLVEILLTVFLVLSIRFLPRSTGTVWPRNPVAIPARTLLSLAAGAGAAAVALAMFAIPRDTRLADYFFRAAPEISQGNNIVNVIIVDVRGIDTLMEVMVIVVAVLGVAGLIRHRELPVEETPE
ncbi:MAG: DUF4040 domain-containing protein [Deltaproteobacteria bacterium]|nr:DUF4040 domain-containing protein [Deltaproteobacteria bacterium]